MRLGVAIACVFGVPAVASAQDAGPDGGDPDAGSDAGLDAGWDGGDGTCRNDGDCNPGLRCIDQVCGVCGDGDTRPCNEGCGEGTQTCDFDVRYWGPCVPTVEPECQIGDEQPCDHPCGEGRRPCDATSCTWSADCLAVAPIECLPGLTGGCLTPVTLCRGTQTCTNDCQFAACVPDPTVCECAGGPECCGNGGHDPGEECDGEKQCGTNCRWAEARPFRSCSCRTPGTPEASGAILAFAGAALALARRKKTP